jgi:hypothetical protein
MVTNEAAPRNAPLATPIGNETCRGRRPTASIAGGSMPEEGDAMWNLMSRLARARRKNGSEPATPRITDLLPDGTGWREDRRTDGRVFWCDGDGDTLSFHRVAGSGELPLNDPRAFETMARAVAESRRGSLVSAEVVTVARRAAAQIISRLDASQDRYAGMLVLPLDQHTDTVCIETTADADGMPPLDKVRRMLEHVRASWRPLEETGD